MKDLIKDIQRKNKYKSPYGEKYFYETELTMGLVVGGVLDLLLPCTFGLIAKSLSRFGKTFYKSEINYNKLTKILLLVDLAK